MVAQIFTSIGNGIASSAEAFANSYIENLLIVPSFENGDTIRDFQKYLSPAKMALSKKTMNISLFTFKKDADLNQDNNLSAAELTIWFKNNLSLGRELFSSLGIENLDDKTLLSNWDSIKEKLPFGVNEDYLAMLNKTFGYMDLENTTLADVLAFAEALTCLDEFTGGDLTRKLMSLLENVKQGNFSNREAFNTFNTIFSSFKPGVVNQEVNSAVEIVIKETRKILEKYVDCAFSSSVGWFYETYARKQAGMEVGVLDNVGYSVVKAGVKGLKTYTQLEEMRYNQDKGKSTTQRAMSGAAFGFRLR